MSKIPLILATALLGLASAGAAEKTPERVVHRSSVTSSHDPALRITLPRSAKYVGSARWDLYEVADCELHLFAQADEQKRVQRLFWIQFEAYLPTNDHTYKYPFTEKLTHAGLEFDVRARFGAGSDAPKAGSDGERVRMLLEKAGLSLPGELMNVRLVHLPDESKRNELMIIYVEDLAPSGSTVADFSGPGGEARWAEIKAGLIARALESLEIRAL